MNYLAHLLLSGPSLDRQVGGLLGDFVKGPLQGAYPPPIEQGILLHRQIDSVTNRMPQVTNLCTLFAPPWRRYAGIVIDITFDHLLAQHWHKHHPRTLDEFCAVFYQHLRLHHNSLPEPARQFSIRAPGLRWLESYADADVVPVILHRVGQKLRKPVALGEAWPLVLAHKDYFMEEFNSVMAELTIFAQRFIADHPTARDPRRSNSSPDHCASSIISL